MGFNVVLSLSLLVVVVIVVAESVGVEGDDDFDSGFFPNPCPADSCNNDDEEEEENVMGVYVMEPGRTNAIPCDANITQLIHMTVRIRCDWIANDMISK